MRPALKVAQDTCYGGVFFPLSFPPREVSFPVRAGVPATHPSPITYKAPYAITEVVSQWEKPQWRDVATQDLKRTPYRYRNWC